MDRGLREYPQKMFLSIIRQAKKYELFDELLDAYYLLQTLYIRWAKSKEAEDLNVKIDFYERVRTLLNKTKRVQRNFEVAAGGKSNVNDLNARQLEVLYEYYEETGSVNVISIYYLLSIAYYKATKDVIMIRETSQKLLDIVLESSVLYSRARLFYLHSELAYYNRLMFDFEGALIMLKEAKTQSKGRSVMSFNLGLSDIIINVFKLKYQLALNACANLLKEYEKGFQYERSVTIYYKSISFFGLGQYEEAQSILSQKNEIEKDKEGWNVWIRIMRLLCSIELLKLNLIDYDMESFRKYIERTSKQYEVRERDKLILKVLLELDKQGYNFNQTASSVAEELAQLKSTDKKYAWNPDSPELILFHDWFNAKLLKKEYEPNFDIYREAMKQTKV